MTIARRLAAMGSGWILLVAGSASVVAAGGPISPPPPVCPALAIVLLPCELPLPTPIPPITSNDTGVVSPLITDVGNLLSLTDLADELLPVAEPLPVGELLSLTEPLPVGELLQPVPALLGTVGVVDQPAAEPAAVEPGAAGQALVPATGDPTQSTPAARTPVAPVVDESWGRHELAGQAAAAGASARRPVDVAAGEAPARIGGSLPAAPLLGTAAVAITLALGGGASLVVDLARGGGSWAGVIAFNVWLRRQLREARMSQRQLAAFSGVDHSTISRLVSGERAPSLATATKLADALRKLDGIQHVGDYFSRLAESRELPTRRVEAALLGDDELDDQDVRELMHVYVVARARRRRVRAAAAEGGEAMPSEGPRPA
ncbi:MAG: helix-turn-helix domain-containing protein [Chloroflexi bacterium]|nr:helix-turn-helix domain-containing protein [Chloroflexota bacterium]